jgi:serine/threonine-protein kinase
MSADPSIVGRTLGGRFRILGFIGEGGMASVYRAVQEAEPRDVAVKILHPHLVSDGTFVRRFRREARAAARIVHPRSVRILDTGVDGNLLYIAMELLAGQDLFEVLVLERRLTEARAARIVAQVADALTAAHESGVVHRDLKPENIMLLPSSTDPSGEEVKVLDFGIAKILEPELSPDGATSMQAALTGVDSVVGTPAYMSPEQCRGEPVDHRSDVYACGVLLHQLVSGRLPFAASSPMEVAVMHVRTPPPPLTTLVPHVDPRLATIVLTALAKWPGERQQTAAELRDALLALLPELATRAPEAADPASPAPSSQVTPDSRRATEIAPVRVSITAHTPDPPIASAATPPPSLRATGASPAVTLVQARVVPTVVGARRGLRGWLAVLLVVAVAAGAVAFLIARR